MTHMEACLDGSEIYTCGTDAPWRCEAIRCLARLGALDFYPEFPRPFFRVRIDGGIQMKGVEGEQTCQVVFPQEGREAKIAAFGELLNELLGECP